MQFWQHEKQYGFPRINAWLIGVCTTALFLWLLIKPAPSEVVVAVDGLCGALFPAIAGIFNLRAIFALNRTQTEDAVHIASLRRSSFFFLGGIFCMVAGQSVTIGYQIILQQAPPTPSLADVCYLGIYPCILLGILVLPNARRSQLTRARVVIDSLMILSALVTCSWYFLLGPTLLKAQDSVLGRIVRTFYPLGDIVLLLSLLFIVYRANPAPFRFGLKLLTCGLLIVVASDTILDYQTLHNTFAPGTLLDIGWVLGPMLAAWAAQALVNAGVRMQHDADPPAMSPHGQLSLWRAVLPYLLVPVVGLLFGFILYHPTDLILATGVYLGGALLIASLVSRQFISIRETIAFAREMQALHEKNVRLQALSTTDPLTNLPNHRALQEVLHKELTMATLQGIPLSLVMIDIDHFREFNDQYGHDVGDRVLQHVARTMQGALDGNDFVSRYGGEEFVVIARASDERAIAQTAERIRAAIADSMFIVSSGARVPITASLGHSTFPIHASVASSLLKAADLALFAAKRSGRNRIAQYSLALLTAQAQEGEQPLALPSEASLETVQALITAIDLRDGYTAAHSEGVSRYAVAIGTKLG
ncbi:MAG TPA: diguanylate cyclase, partial [Ktedonobacterales bacterium]|nr:diguanylate cyclase [Ktedonobacterales bacterium]